jgi:hypothetical protein
MTDEQRFEAISKALMEHRRFILRLLARLKAIERMTASLVPDSAREKWSAEVDRLSHRFLQSYLEWHEDQSAWFGAALDDRGPDELSDL